jgi:hypothetical protein
MIMLKIDFRKLNGCQIFMLHMYHVEISNK